MDPNGLTQKSGIGPCPDPCFQAIIHQDSQLLLLLPNPTASQQAEQEDEAKLSRFSDGRADLHAA